MENTEEKSGRLKQRRRRALIILALIFGLIAIIVGVYWFVSLRQYETTEDAYVGGNVIQVTPQVPGTVISIAADDTDFVRAGQSVVVLDQADTRVALEQAQAELARTVRQVRTVFAETAALRADVAAREAELA